MNTDIDAVAEAIHNSMKSRLPWGYEITVRDDIDIILFEDEFNFDVLLEVVNGGIFELGFAGRKIKLEYTVAQVVKRGLTFTGTSFILRCV